jgi:hypothetical protein
MKTKTPKLTPPPANQPGLLPGAHDILGTPLFSGSPVQVAPEAFAPRKVERKAEQPALFAGMEKQRLTF